MSTERSAHSGTIHPSTIAKNRNLPMEQLTGKPLNAAPQVQLPQAKRDDKEI